MIRDVVIVILLILTEINNFIRMSPLMPPALLAKGLTN